VIGTKLIL
jgi:hypothetical protein